MNFKVACETFRKRLTALFGEAAEVVVETAASGLTESQIIVLTNAIAASGEKLEIPSELAPMTDVPSTGGPASLSTLLCPLLIASRGFKVPKLSATGSIAGGIDTMGVIEGFNTKLAGQAFIKALASANVTHAEPSEDFCHADKYIIECRRKRKMMANPALAASSLLAKKLAVPGSSACFDFRVGTTGNIGANFESARQTAKLFQSIAKRLGIKISVVLTDNNSFPCSALGRLESLNLLWALIAKERPVGKLDSEHLQTCVRLSDYACTLADPSSTPTKHEKNLYDLLRTGHVLETFEKHLAAQGTDLEQFKNVMKLRETMTRTLIFAPETGFWIPPNLDFVKEWFKQCHKTVEKNIRLTAPVAAKQLGFRLLADPGSRVSKGDPVIEVRFPSNTTLILKHELLVGSIVPSAVSKINHSWEYISP